MFVVVAVAVALIVRSHGLLPLFSHVSSLLACFRMYELKYRWHGDAHASSKPHKQRQQQQQPSAAAAIEGASKPHAQ